MEQQVPVLLHVVEEKHQTPPEQKTNLSSLSETASVTLKSDTKTVNVYKTALISEIKKQSGFEKLTEADLDITKSDGNVLSNGDIVQGILNTKVSAKQSSINFTGHQNIKVTITIVQIELKDVVNDKNLGTINIPQSIVGDSDKKKLNTLILFYLKTNHKNTNLRTFGVNVSDVNINERNEGTARVKSNNRNYYTNTSEVINISFAVSKEKIVLSKLVIQQFIITNADTLKKMSDLDLSKIFEIFKLIKLTTPTIEYQDLQGKNINEENQQKAAIFQVKIAANKNDLIIQGQ